MKYHLEHTENPYISAELEITFDALDKITELSKTASKVYKYIRGRSYKEDGIVYFDIEDAMNHCDFKGEKSIYNALSELINSDILAGRKSSHEYYFNPKFINDKKEMS